jgi:hypothetical protein
VSLQQTLRFGLMRNLKQNFPQQFPLLATASWFRMQMMLFRPSEHLTRRLR